MERIGAPLAVIDVLRDLPADALQGLARQCAWKEYAPRQQIVGHQDPTRNVFFLVRGKVRAIIYSQSGREVTFRDIEAGEMFGEFAAIDGEPRSASVEAVKPSLVASMAPDLFWKVLHDHPPVAAATLKRLTRQVRSLSERVFEFSTLAVKNRIHAELLRLAGSNIDDDGTARLSPAPTHADIASRISTHREAVTRELNELAHAGLIERRGNELVIRDVSRLNRMVHDVLGY